LLIKNESREIEKTEDRMKKEKERLRDSIGERPLSISLSPSLPLSFSLIFLLLSCFPPIFPKQLELDQYRDLVYKKHRGLLRKERNYFYAKKHLSFVRLGR